MNIAFDKSRRLVPPSSAKRVRSERGEIACWQIAPDIIATRIEGVMTREMSRLIIDQIDRLDATVSRVHCFNDWLEMSSYDSVCRTDLTAWMLKRRERTVLHIAVRSRLVAMGVSVANLALGGMMHVHATESALERALAETLANTQR